MIADKIQQLTVLKAELAKLEKQVAEEQGKELGSLPQQYGFATTAEFIAAVQAASGGRRGRTMGSSTFATKPQGRGARRRRGKVTDELRAELKKMVEGGKTGAEIGKALGISLPTVQNIKTSLGLVKKRK